MNCTHDLTEREMAVTAEGYCPLCMVHIHVEDRARIKHLETAMKAIADSSGGFRGPNEFLHPDRANYIFAAAREALSTTSNPHDEHKP
jgi:hypothetical protein